MSIFLVLLMLLIPAVTGAVNDHGLATSAEEQRAREADAHQGFITSGCSPVVPASSLTIGAFPCQGYASEAGQLYYIDQATATITVPDSPVVWLFMDRSTNRSVAGFTRQGLTHYIFIAQATEPATPPGAILFAQVNVVASVIDTIEFLRLSAPWSRSLGVLSITDPPFNAIGDDSTDNTLAIQAAIDAAERTGADRLKVYVPFGIFRHTGLTLTKGITIEGGGWGSILKNTSATVDSLHHGPTGTGDTELYRVRIADIQFQHSGGGSVVDCIDIEEIPRFLSIERVYCNTPPRDGIRLTGVLVANGNILYTMLAQNWMSSCGRDCLSITGPSNSGQVIGGRYDNNGRHGISIADADASQPNTWTVMGADIPGACNVGTYATCAPLFDNGNNNKYIGLRFEGTEATRPDVLLGAQSVAAQFFGTEFAPGTVDIDDSALTTPSWKGFGQDHAVIDPVHPNGFLGFYDNTISGCATRGPGIGACRRDMPKRGRHNVRVPTIAAGTDEDFSLMRCEDPITITDVFLIPDDAHTGANTDNMILRLSTNTGSGGVGTTNQVETFDLGTDLVAHQAFDLLNCAGCSAAVGLNCDQGDVILLRKAENGTGAIMPAMSVQIEFEGGEH